MLNLLSNINTENIKQQLEKNFNLNFKNFNFINLLKILNKSKKKDNFNILIINFAEVNEEYLEELANVLSYSQSRNIIFSLYFNETKINNLSFTNQYNNYSFFFLNLIKKNINNKHQVFFYRIDDLSILFNNKFYDYSRWHLTKNPFSINFELFFSKKIYEIYKLIIGNRIKAIFIDLDDTLWGGILAELGYKKILLGKFTPIGEAYKEFQKLIKNFVNSGIILGIISRNYENVALSAIKNNNEMIIKLEDIAGYKINFKNKSENILELCNDLKILPESVLFIDNNIYEINEVESKIKKINTLHLGENVFLFSNLVRSRLDLSYLNLTKEDLLRSKNYSVFSREKKIYTSSIDHNDWLKKLSMIVEIKKFNKDYLERYVQMYSKINQFNLSTKRKTIKTIENENKKPESLFYTISVKDKFSDLGIVGLMKLKKNKKTLIVEDFLFSCRALGRRLEDFFFHYVLYNNFSNNFTCVIFNFQRTDKNKLMKEFLNIWGINENNKFQINALPRKDFSKKYITNIINEFKIQ